jgi:phosphopantothenoylcysteine synthetase/decarboxylase
MPIAKLLLGVTGGIAAYKAVELVRLFTKADMEVRVIMTAAAQAFVTPLTFSSLTNHPVATKILDPSANWEIEHIELAKWADVAVVAPATANIIGKFASGIADDLLSTVLMALPQETTLVFAPAMNTRMWNSPILQDNLDKLHRLLGPRFKMVQPVSKNLACKEEGMGAMASVDQIFAQISGILQA